MGHSIDKDCCFESDGFWFRYRAAAIIIEDGCVLMAHNDVDDYYYSIGGGVHLGETSKEAVIREVKEETGVTYEVERLAFVNESLFYGNGSLNGKECHVIELYYLMKPKGRQVFENGDTKGNILNSLGGIPEYLYWIPLEQFKDLKAFPEFFSEKLSKMPEAVEHFISEERDINIME